MEAQATEHFRFLIVDTARNQADNFIVTGTVLQGFASV